MIKFSIVGGLGCGGTVGMASLDKAARGVQILRGL